MRRVQPGAAVALPPIQGPDVLTEPGGWTCTLPLDKKAKLHKGGAKKPVPGRDASPRASQEASARLHPEESKKQRSQSQSPTRAAAAQDGMPQSGHSFGMASARGASVDRLSAPSKPPTTGEEKSASGPDGRQNAMKGRVIETWLNHTLGQANARSMDDANAAAVSASAASTTAKQVQGLSQFGVDAAALERLGLDSHASERVYRAMFVYSQGLHAVLQEAVGKSKNASQALLVLWRAFTAVLEHAGQSEQHGAESLAALVARGNEEEKRRIQEQYSEQLNVLQAEGKKLVTERRSMQEELERLKEDEVRLHNDLEMYRSEHLVAVSKYEREIKQRVVAEVKFLEKTRWADALQEDLAKERKQGMQISTLLQEANAAQESAQVELDGLRMQVKTLEAQAASYKQNALEAAQQRQRHEQQVAQYKQNIERMGAKINELKEQLDAEAEQVKKLSEQRSAHQREVRRLETQYEDELHARKELQAERDHLREKIERLDKDLSQLTEERRNLQKEINDLSMSFRTNQIELKRKVEQLERTEKQHEKLSTSHRQLLDQHRTLCIEAENLREDVTHLDEQFKRESDLRKQLQSEVKQLQGKLQLMQMERDAQLLAVQGMQKELKEATEKGVRFDSIVRDTKHAMSKLRLEHQVELKAHAQKVAMLEKVVADERKERRNLVNETQEVCEKREDALDKLKEKRIECHELQRRLLEKEEEVDRLKILLRAQEQRNSEQLVTVDKYQAAVARHDAEVRQMQVLLECEREEAKKALQEMQEAHQHARHLLDRRVEHGRMYFEDAFSRLNFNPAADKLLLVEAEVEELKGKLEEAQVTIDMQDERFKNIETFINQKERRIEELEGEVQARVRERDQWIAKHTKMVHAVECEAMARNDAEHHCERIRQNNLAFDQMKASLESKLAAARNQIAGLQAELNKPKAEAATQTISNVLKSSIVQTDLSYQYLESTQHLQADRWRREKMELLKTASHFVEDAQAQRDFTVQTTSSQVEERALSGKALDLDVSQRVTLESSSAAGSSGGKFFMVGDARATSGQKTITPRSARGGHVPEPAPMSARKSFVQAPAGLPPSSAAVQAMRTGLSSGSRRGTVSSASQPRRPQ
eukprot:TRINITY_DN81953_c0_g1_i1.p1 TRINITY_DN81953_c0_g1~~TRINITY_DN81953_c0_g1_i1.p1  ORF type:complete len:1108 (+),score=400.14 TRINITY_DN81953_c0_g1_i1:151-3474(+)